MKREPILSSVLSVLSVVVAGMEGGTEVMATQDISIASPPGLVSIVIPCVGMLDYTTLCMESADAGFPAPVTWLQCRAFA